MLWKADTVVVVEHLAEEADVSPQEYVKYVMYI